MKLTEQIRSRLWDYKKDNQKSLSDVHRDIIRSGADMTYESFRGFMNAATEASGHTLNDLHNFLEEKEVK